MKKPITIGVIAVIALVLLIPLSGSNFIQQSYASTDVEEIELELQGWKKIELDKSDLFLLKITSFNNGKYASDFFWDYIYLVDSQKRTFEPERYLDSELEDYRITRNDCPAVVYTTINPGLSAEEILCYEIPKLIGDSFSLDLYNTAIELCDGPFGRDCTFKSFPFTTKQQSESDNSTSSKIPDWVKNIFLWYVQDQVSEDELLNAIKYLITEGILVISPEQQTQIDPPSLEIDVGSSDETVDTTQSSSLCSGTARCFSGTVTQVIDGDTIKVDGKSIRFSLASAPELHQFEGDEAKWLIDTICPVGSTALVDEDDGQTEGSYGRIIAVIYCNDLNLNEELLDSSLGYLSSGFCSRSEFASSSWAQKHGCSDSYEPKTTTPPAEIKEDCDPSYPDFCIPTPPPDLDCGDIPQKRFTVLPPDPHRFDGDKDGIGCES